MSPESILSLNYNEFAHLGVKVIVLHPPVIHNHISAEAVETEAWNTVIILLATLCPLPRPARHAGIKALAITDLRCAPLGPLGP